jgi:hypothetical protein
MGKSTQTTVPTKRKLTANNSDKRTPKKLKTNEKHKMKEEALLVGKESKETKDVTVKISDNNDTCSAVKKPERKTETDKAKDAAQYRNEKCPDKSDSQGSSDDLPLSEILKQSKAEKNVKKKPNIKRKTTKPLNQIGKKVEGKVELSKSEAGLGISNENIVKKKTQEISLSTQKKTVKTNIKKNVETSSKDTKTIPSNSKQCQLPSPVKCKSGVKERSLVKHGGSPGKTKSIREKILNKKHSPLKEFIQESELGSHSTDEDGEESDMDWEDVAGNCAENRLLSLTDPLFNKA